MSFDEKDTDERFFDLMWDNGLVEKMVEFARQVDAEARQDEAGDSIDWDQVVMIPFTLAALDDVVEAVEHVIDHGCPESGAALRDWVYGELAPLFAGVLREHLGG